MKTRTLRLMAISAAFFASFLFFGYDAVHGQGRYVGQYSKADVSSTIERLEESSDEFRNDFRREINQSNLSSSRKRTYNGYVANFEDAIDQLRKHFDDQNSWWNSRSRVQSAINNSQQVNTMMNQLPFQRNLERQWSRLRNNINALADTYDLAGLDGGGWSGGGGGSGGGWGGGGGSGGGQTITPPSWAQGTFYGSAGGTQITLTISRNGSVNADIGGQMNYGTFTRGNYLQIAGATARVTRQGNGLLTTRTDNGESIAYTRSSWGGGSGEGGWNPGNQISPPSWARGTFVGRASNGSEITLTISGNGSVTAIIDGQPINGSYTQGNILSIAGAYARVSSLSRGLRTVRTDSGETIDYRRR